MTKIRLSVAAAAVLAALLVPLVLATGAARAAPIADCIIYARDYARNTVAIAPPGSVPALPLADIQNAAYVKCRNSAHVPTIPTRVVPSAPSTDANAAPPRSSARKEFFPSFDEVFGATDDTLLPTPPAPVTAAPVIPKSVASYSAVTEPPPKPRSVKAIAETFGQGSLQTAPPVAPAVVAEAACISVTPHFWRGTISFNSGC